MPSVSVNPSATIAGAGDGWRVPGGAGDYTSATLNLGQIVVSKTQTDYFAYFRFELDIPAGAVINGVSLSLTSSGAGAGNELPYGRLGLLDPDGSWETADGLDAYGGMGSAPNLYTDALFYNSVPTVTADNWHPALVTAAGQEAGYWEGTGVSSLWEEISGLVSDVSGFLAANEALRDTGVGSGIPIMFGICANNTTTGSWFNRVYTSDDVTTSNWPLLTVDYTVPTLGPISARAASGQVVAARGRSALAANARSAPSTAVSGRISSSQVVSGRAATAPVVRGRTRTS